MGMLTEKKAGGGLDAGGLAGMLKREADGFDLGTRWATWPRD
jgi:hypothetical protein